MFRVTLHSGGLSMRLTRIVLALGIAAGMAAVATPAQALTCYDVGFDHLPNAWVQANPPKVIFDDGDPYVRQYPC
jgi:hypothetical protein